MSLLGVLANIKVAAMGDDQIGWPHSSKGKFTINGFRREGCEGSTNIVFSSTQYGGLRLFPKLAFWLGHPQTRCLKGKV